MRIHERKGISSPLIARTLADAPRHRGSPPGCRLFRYFLLLSVLATVTILVVAGVGLRFVLRDFVIREAEEDAIRICAAIRDCEMDRFIGLKSGKTDCLSIPQTELPELDRQMRAFIAPFGIVKIKIFDRETRIIYSTDSKIIGKLNRDNSKLAISLSGSPISKHESKDQVWDLEEEIRYDVEIVETYVPIRGPDGKIVGSFEVYKDVTRHLVTADTILIHALLVLLLTILIVLGILLLMMNRAARVIDAGTAALRDSEQRFRQLAENIGEVFWMCSPNWHEILYISPAYEQVWGRSCRSLYERPESWLEAIVEEDHARVIAEIDNNGITKSSMIRLPEFRIRRPDGTERWILARAFPIRNERGEMYRIVGLAEDITDRKRAEEELQLQKEFLENILESLAHPFYVVDAEDYTVKLANSAARRMGLSEGNTCHSLTHKRNRPCDGTEHTCPLEKVKKTGKPLTVEHIHYDRSGKPSNHEVHGHPVFDKQGNVKQVIEYSLDVTERKQAEERSKKTLADLERFNRLAVGRELRMIELKCEVNEMAERAGLDRPYDLAFAETPTEHAEGGA